MEDCREALTLERVEKMSFSSKRFEVKIVDHCVQEDIPEDLYFEIFDNKKYNQKKDPHVFYTKNFPIAQNVTRYLNLLDSLKD